MNRARTNDAQVPAHRAAGAAGRRFGCWLRCTVLALNAASTGRLVAQAPASQPSAAELMGEIRLLREQMQQQQQRHESEMKALQAQIDALRPPGTQPTSVTSRPSAKEELQQALSGATGAAPASAPAGNAEAELEALIAGAAPAGPAASTGGPLSLLGRLNSAGQSFNPDISLNGDFLAAYSNRDGGKLDDEFLF